MLFYPQKTGISWWVPKWYQYFLAYQPPVPQLDSRTRVDVHLFQCRLRRTTCQWEHRIRKYRRCTGIPPNIEMPKTGDSHMIFSDFRIFYQTVYPNDPNSPLTKDIDQIEKLNLKYMQIHFHPSILYQLRLSVGHTIYLAVGRILRWLDYSQWRRNYPIY